MYSKKKSKLYTHVYEVYISLVLDIYICIYIYGEIYTVQAVFVKGDDRVFSENQEVTSLSLFSLSRLRPGWWRSRLA